MRVRTLEIEGFQSFRDAQTIDLTGRDLVAIVGENHSGKTSVVDALTWCVLGVTRGAAVTDVIHRGSQLARVTAVLNLADGTYRIARTRTRRGRHEVLLSVADQSEPSGWRNLAEKHSSVTDADIVAKIGMDAETSALTWLVGQGQASSFCEMKPTERRTALAKAFGLGVYSDLAAEADVRRKEAASAMDRATWALEQAQERAAGINTALAELGEPETLRTEAARAWDEVRSLTDALSASGETGLSTARAELTRLLGDHDRAMAAHLTEQTRAEAALSAARHGAERAELELADAVKTRESLSGQQSAIEEARTEISQLTALETEHTETITLALETKAEAAAQAQAAEATKDEMTKRLQALAAGAEGGRCIVCSSELTAEHAARLEAETRRALDVATDALAAHTDRAAWAAADIGVAEQNRDKARARCTALREPLTQADRDLAVAQTVARRVPALTQARDDAAAHLADAQAQLEGLTAPVLDETRAGTLRAAVEGDLDDDTAQQALSGAQQRARDLEASVATATRLLTERESVAAAVEKAVEEHARAAGHLDTAATLVEAFRPSGIPAMVLAGVVTELNTEANAIMDATGTDGLRVRVSTQKTNAKGGTSEAVMVYAVTSGGEADFATLSGSEKFRVALSIRLGLARCIARRTGTPVRTIVLDEGWGALDEPTRQAVSGVLASLTGQFGVLTVSHVDDVKASFPYQVKVDASTGTSLVTAHTA
ncbi:AAA family ATPase [Ornithinimicrobium murale]|uniref:AAA family ATPase n=1 Tax=Ornithinimicrobium murale TaxID=1050153 RepID=UPI000E0D6AEF|nr:SMC family ATPase [Ornithinimicrobium murale]